MRHCSTVPKAVQILKAHKFAVKHKVFNLMTTISWSTRVTAREAPCIIHVFFPMDYALGGVIAKSVSYFHVKDCSHSVHFIHHGVAKYWLGFQTRKKKNIFRKNGVQSTTHREMEMFHQFPAYSGGSSGNKISNSPLTPPVMHYAVSLCLH